MKLAMTAITPAEGFNDKATCFKKVVGPMLDAMREQLRNEVPMKGEFRISILVDTLAGKESDEVAKAVQRGIAAAN